MFSVDAMKYMMLVRHGEVHVMKNFSMKVRGAETAVHTRRRGNIGVMAAGMSLDKKMKMLEKRPDQGVNVLHRKKLAKLCILGPNAAFLERSMFTSLNKEKDDMKDEEEVSGGKRRRQMFRSLTPQHRAKLYRTKSCTRTTK